MGDMWSNLPHDMLILVYAFLPWQIRMKLTKQNYLLFHSLFENTLPCARQDGLLRQIIRQDFDFVFFVWAKENQSQWHNRKKYKYQGRCFNDYEVFLQHFCVQHQASRCQRLFFVKKKDKRI